MLFDFGWVVLAWREFLFVVCFDCFIVVILVGTCLVLVCWYIGCKFWCFDFVLCFTWCVDVSWVLVWLMLCIACLLCFGYVLLLVILCDYFFLFGFCLGCLFTALSAYWLIWCLCVWIWFYFSGMGLLYFLILSLLNVGG